MPPKKNSKDQKKVKKIVEDRTFGMKNKKGAAQQKKVQQIQSSLQNSNRKGGGSKQPMSKKKLQAERDEELRQLGLLNVVPKSTQNQKSNTNLQEEIVEEVPKSLEEILEELRANLKGPLTKVTKASFEEWHAKKQAEKAEKRRIKMGKREKDIASGKVAMTGRELYEKKKDIFVDDNNADDDHYELYENLNQAIEDQLKLMEDASGETWDQERIQKERLKLEQEMAKSEEDRKKLLQKKLEETTIEIEDESLFVEEDIPDE